MSCTRACANVAAPAEPAVVAVFCVAALPLDLVIALAVTMLSIIDFK